MITEADRKFLDSFEQCSMGAACWTHASHVRIGWLMLETSSSFDEAIERLRSGIMKFNSSKNSIGYHETITVAFAKLIRARWTACGSWRDFEAANGDLFSKDCLSAFYSPNILSSDVARAKFVEPDLKCLPEMK